MKTNNKISIIFAVIGILMIPLPATPYYITLSILLLGLATSWS